MTIEAETLVALTEALQERGVTFIADVAFVRAPYRANHRWVCTVK